MKTTKLFAIGLMLAMMVMGCRLDPLEDDTDSNDGDSAIDSNTTCTEGERTCEGTVINVCENGNFRWMRNCADAGMECKKGECVEPGTEPEPDDDDNDTGSDDDDDTSNDDDSSDVDDATDGDMDSDPEFEETLDGDFYSELEVEYETEMEKVEEEQEEEIIIIPSCDPDPCNGHGECDNSTGIAICTCEENVTGEFCDRCIEGFDGYPDCGPQCENDDDCLYLGV